MGGKRKQQGRLILGGSEGLKPELKWMMMIGGLYYSVALPQRIRLFSTLYLPSISQATARLGKAMSMSSNAKEESVMPQRGTYFSYGIRNCLSPHFRYYCQAVALSLNG